MKINMRVVIKKRKRKIILNIKCSNKRKCFIAVDRLFKTRLCTYDRGVNTRKKEIKNILNRWY